MKGYQVSFNVLGKSGLPTPVTASVSVKDVSREAAVRAALKLMVRHGVPVSGLPCAVRALTPRGRPAPPRRAGKAAPGRDVWSGLEPAPGRRARH